MLAQENGIVRLGDLKFSKLFSEEQVLQSIKRIADELNNIYIPILKQNPNEKIIIVSILKGAFMFTSDLIKLLRFPTLIDFIRVTSYKGMQSTQVTIKSQIDKDLYKDAHLIIVDDICDSGRTLENLVKKMYQLNAKTVRTAVLVLRPDKKQNVQPNHHGLNNSRFIIGYGLDYCQMGRQFPCIYQKIDQ